MKKKSNNPIFEEEPFKARIIAASGNSVIVKVRQSGSKIIINPPPKDMRCEICGRKAVDLEPFDEKYIEILIGEERIMNGHFQGGRCITKSITADHKIAKNFRSFYKDMVQASWECTDCHRLSNKEAIETKDGRHSLSSSI